MPIYLEQGTNHTQLIYDTHPFDFPSLEKLVAFARQQVGAHKPITLFLAGPFQGSSDYAVYDRLATLLRTQQVAKLVVIGDALAHHATVFEGIATQRYPDIATLLTHPSLAEYNTTLVVKNNPAYSVAPICHHLSQNDHHTVLEINLDAIAKNLQFFRQQLHPQTQVIAMVKAQAYGSSSFEIAQFLQACQVDYLAVCYAQEGVLLRQQGIHLPIMVMNPAVESFQHLQHYNLEPALYSLSILKSWKDFTAHQQPKVPCHIKLDTGLHRLGIMPAEMPALLTILQSAPSLALKSICSHWAAPTPAEASYTHHQTSLFQQQAKDIEKNMGKPLLKHISNTYGVYHFPNYQFDMVRIGIGLYGISEQPQPGLTMATTFKTLISQIKQVPPGATIGYDRQGIAKQPTRIAVLDVGYADGFRRSLSNGVGRVWINGQIAPVVGNVCMDMTMVDVTTLAAEEGDEAIIFGPPWPIAHILQATSTIAHEVLTNVGPRVRRIYVTASS
jgi:alanine racemase